MSNKYIITVTLDEFIDDLIDVTEDGISWGNSVGLSLVGSLLAISLIRFLFFKD